MDRRLFRLAREGTNRFGVGDRVRHVPRDRVARVLANLHELVAMRDERTHDDERDREHRREHDDEPAREAREHEHREHQRDDVAADREGEDVHDLLVTARVAKRALREGAGEVVLEERRVLHEELVHRLDVELPDAVVLEDRDQPAAESPDAFAGEPRHEEENDGRSKLGRARFAFSRENAEQVRDREGRQVPDEDVADAGREERRGGEPGPRAHASGVATNDEGERRA